MLCIRMTICIMQVIDTGDGIVQNIAEFIFFGMKGEEENSIPE